MTQRPEHNLDHRKIPLLVTYVLIGAYAIVAQVVFIREFLVVLYGNELCLGIILGSWLTGIALGAWVGARLVSRLDLMKTFVGLILIMVLCLPGQVFLVRIVRSLVEVAPGQYVSFLSMVRATVGLVTPFSFLIGFIFPFACRLYVRDDSGAAIQIGRVYILESVGSMIGGAAFTFILVLYLNSFEALAVLGILLLAGTLALTMGNRKGVAVLCALLLAAYLIALLSGAVDRLDEYSITRRWRAFNDKIEMVESTDSKYQNITIGKDVDQYSVFGNGQYISSFPDDYSFETYAHFVMVEHPDPRDVLLIGGGIEGLLRQILKHPVQRLHYVELDPQLAAIVSRYVREDDRAALKDPRVTVFYDDGRSFVKSTRDTYDLVIVNLPDPTTAMLNRFYTRDFYEEVAEILKDRGVLVTGVSSAVGYVGEEIGNFSGSVYRTLHDVFPHVLVTPGEVNHYFATFAKGVITFDTGVLARRYIERGIEAEYFSQYHYQILLPEERVEFIRNALSRRTVRANTDERPVTYFFNLVLWDRYSGSKGAMSGKLFTTVSRLSLRWFILALAALLSLRLCYIALARGRRGSFLRFNSLLAIGTTGLAGMALEIILLFAFQNIYGYLYQHIGLIVALFMLGLALGGLAMNRIMPRLERHVRVLIVAEVLITLYAIALPLLLRHFSAATRANLPGLGSQYVFMALVAVAGWLTGFEFPLASKIYLDCGVEAGRTAGMVDGADHLGACLGALLTGVILVPLLGVGESCLLVGVLNAGSAALLVCTPLMTRETLG